MKKNTLLIAGMAALALTFGLVLAGCGGADDTENTDPRELVITNIPATLLGAPMAGTSTIMVGLYPPGVTLAQVGQQTNVVAGAQSSDGSMDIFDTNGTYYKGGQNTLATQTDYSGKAYLYAAPFAAVQRWKGIGTYDVTFVDTAGSISRVKRGVPFSSGLTTISYNAFNTLQ